MARAAGLTQTATPKLEAAVLIQKPTGDDPFMMSAASKSRLGRLALIGVAVAAMAACNRRPPAQGATPDAGAVPSGPATNPAYPTAPTGPVALQPRPAAIAMPPKKAPSALAILKAA